MDTLDTYQEVSEEYWVQHWYFSIFGVSGLHKLHFCLFRMGITKKDWILWIHIRKYPKSIGIQHGCNIDTFPFLEYLGFINYIFVFLEWDRLISFAFICDCIGFWFQPYAFRRSCFSSCWTPQHRVYGLSRDSVERKWALGLLVRCFTW